MQWGRQFGKSGKSDILFSSKSPSTPLLYAGLSSSSPHSVLTRGALGEVVNLTKPMIESGLGGLDRPCASLITLCSSHLGHFYGQKLPKNGHIWVHRP